MKIIQFANILLTGNSNNIVFTQFPIMNKMRVMLPLLYNRKPFVTYIYSLFFRKFMLFSAVVMTK